MAVYQGLGLYRPVYGYATGDHPIHRQNASPDSDGSECDLSAIIPSNSTSIQYNEVDGTSI
jgi:hypothetical protein